MSEQATLVGKSKFTSPIGASNSFSSWTISEKEKCTMELYFYKDNTGFIEWDIPNLGMTECIGLTFDIDVKGKRTLVDYDGIFAIPDQAMDLLEKHGVDCKEMRKSMNS
jgi:hypothetical protein